MLDKDKRHELAFTLAVEHIKQSGVLAVDNPENLNYEKIVEDLYNVASTFNRHIKGNQSFNFLGSQQDQDWL